MEIAYQVKDKYQEYYVRWYILNIASKASMIECLHDQAFKSSSYYHDHDI